ncbi:hypothetical protein A1O3_01265 [Capronia epimyces CBS 606.96]|uniref:Palmitoyltransferase n=1 Tax=Capronia epimyces CBS 606.96 TaxID=1182542 RepID=W9YJH8_9EURO|nr:uncharacterized protein A1O3_01265 [Capronia epimyces CBS 606.96]EXJ92713.1 hypothetical protein A1O3_01265 [Capronia epimyces CBS 606.96]
MKLLRPREANKRGNIATARIVPALLLGIIAYSSWVVTKHVCLDYLIHPRPRASVTVHSQTGAAIAILVIFYLLLLIALTCLGRLLQTILTRPGFVPRGPQWNIEKEKSTGRARSASRKEEALEHSSTEGYTPRHLRRHRRDEEFPTQDFWHKDVFACGWDGRPPFCSTCYNYKPDRAHHCSELGRCVLKMDHFCPWVGGIVSETSFKYFIQFTFWAALFCLDTLVVVAYYFAKRRRDERFINVHWILALAFASLFLLFSAGMCGSSLQFAFVNSSTIEHLTRKTKVWYLAVYIPRQVFEKYQASGRDDLRLITYPRPPSEQFQILQLHGAKDNDSQQSVAREAWHPSRITPPAAAYDQHSRPAFPSNPVASSGNITPSARSRQDSLSLPVRSEEAADLKRTFAILETAPGENPFDIGWFNNFKEVMGFTLLDWFLPLRPSPLLDHSDPTSMYKLGTVVSRMKKEAGIDDDDHHEDHDANRRGESEVEETGKRRHKKRRRRRRSDASRSRPGSGAVNREER